MSFSFAIVIACSIAIAVRRMRLLSAGGAIAAALLGMVAMRAGTAWGAFLVLWFMVAAIVSRIGHTIKATRLRSVVTQHDARTATQVLANGACFASCACMNLLADSGGWPVIGAAALAAAGADTWATEVGTLIKSDAWSVRMRSTVPAGTSGAVSWGGTVGLFAGALLFALMAVATHLVALRELWVVLTGAAAGALLDTVVGAFCQERRHCPNCAAATEQRVHLCGATTVHTGGLEGLGNNATNFLATVGGALVAALLLR